ncbi:response regulator [Thiovibrio sp. JS02]
MGKKILVVDNQPVVLKLVANLLAKDGHEVRIAEDGLRALDVLKDFVPDLIFVDLVMPNISGEKLCRIIRNMPHLQGVFLVILSAIAAEDDLDFVALGADACIAKGNMEGLARHIVRVLEMAEQNEGRGPGSRDILGLHEVARREITRELIASRRHFEVILNNMSEGILEYAPDLKLIFVNPAAANMIGVAEENLLGADFCEIFAGYSRDLVERVLHCGTALFKSIPEETPVLLNGRRVSLQFLPVRDEGGDSTIVIINDVTKRKQTEEKVNEQNRFLQGLIEALPHPFFVVDAREYGVVLANSAAKRCFPGMKGCPPGSEGPICACLTPDPLYPFEVVQRERKSFVLAHVDRDGRGRETHYEIHAHPIFDKQGILRQIIQYRLDVTERKNTEQELQASKAALEKALAELRAAR